MYSHSPVFLSEVIDHLQPEPKQVFIDGTVGLGGHAKALLERVLPEGRQADDGPHLLAFDKDAKNLGESRSRLAEYGDAVVFINDSFANVMEHAQAHHVNHVDGVLLDLGFSSAHVDDPSRGFSFKAEGPLDMRYDKRAGLTAFEIVNEWSKDEIARILRVYGEESRARLIATAIVQGRSAAPIQTTTELARMIESAIPRRGRIHPATQAFQALRVAVNDELDDLERALPDLVTLLKTGGRIAVITFHSLEDRIVKRFFKQDDRLEVVNKKVIRPSRDEIIQNPRARSAKLRVARKI